MAAAVRYVRAHAHRPIAVAEILDDVAVSRRSLERRFRRALGRGIWDEIRRVHMECATRLLADSDLPMSEVATASGFSDGKHFAVAFRQETGGTPSAYRRRLRQAAGT